MRTQLIQKKAQIGSQISCTLTTGDQVSGLLTEIGLDHITLNGAKGETTILVEAIIAVQSLDDQGNESVSSEPTPSQIETLNSPIPASNQAGTTKSTTISPDSTEASDSSSISPDQIEAEKSSDSTDSVDLEEQASEKLVDIESRFNAEIQSAKLELAAPDLTFPAQELRGWQKTDVAARWVQIKNRYENARKIGELSAKFGRIQPIVADLKSLVRHFPESTTLKRTLAYFSSISDNWDEALQNYQQAAVQSKKDDDWFEVAVSALRLNKEELACYSLEKFFYGVSIIAEPQAWRVYANLLEKFRNLPAFRELCKTDKYARETEEIEVLLETAIYLLKRMGAAKVAMDIIRKWTAGTSMKSLLSQACENLNGRPAKPYHQFLTEFMNAMLTAEKKTVPLTPEQPNPLRAVKRPAHQQTSQQVVPKSDNLYRKAERAAKNRELELAARYYRACIEQNIRRESALKDLAMVLVRLERSQEAVHLLEENRETVKDKQSLDNMLIAVCQSASQYEKAIDLLNRSLKHARTPGKSSQIRWQIARAYIKLEDYASAANQFRQILTLNPGDLTVQRDLALCLSKQERYEEAGQILKEIQNTSREAKTAELLEAIERAQRTGEFTLDDNRIIETHFSDFSGELSKFARFFLDRCTFEGILADRINEGKYTGSESEVGSDIRGLEDLAKRLGARLPRDRSNYYLSAARIYVDVEDNPNSFYRYLCRSFAYRGDAAVIETRNLDTVRAWYCEALTVYDRDRDLSKYEQSEQDAVDSLVRYLYSTLGHDHIQLDPNKRTSIDKAVSEVIREHPEKKKVFDAIAYLVLRSRYAGDKVLNRLYHDESLRKMALGYLEGWKITIPDTIERFNDFVRPWNELSRVKFNMARNVSSELQLLENFDLTTSTRLEDHLQLAEDIRSKLLFELDRQRVGELQEILKTALELCKQVTFEERERLCLQLLNHCENRLGEIEDNPTRLSVEDVYPILKVIHEKLNAYLENLYETSKPNLTIRLPVESYVPDTNRKIEVQIVVENEGGRSPAESLELDILEDSAFFEVAKSNMGQAESLRGGDQSILEVPLQLTREASRAQTFSLPVHARYRTRAKEQEKTPVENLSIRLYSADEFEEIDNPYAAYAEGGVVGDSKMFFGREELIQNIAHAIQESRLDSKCIVVFGQKRSGKSSVLHHLKASLQKDSELLILDLGNLGSIQEEDSSVPLLHQILKRILTVLEYAIEDRVDAGFTSLALPIPDDSEFYGHPAPLQCFQDTFERLKRQVARHEDWRGVRAVLLIDEFQYIYARIVAGKIPESFMQNWKALLQANYFSAVLVGQDVMPKFKERFPNEFGTTQDERVTYLTQGDARRLVDEPIRIGGPEGESRYREQAIERILELTAGSPFYIQIVCNRLVEYMNSKPAALVTAADVEHVKNELIAGVNALGLDKFDNLINSGDTSADAISDEDARKVLKVIADNSRTGLCHRDTIVCETDLPLDTILNDMVKRDVVERREESYRIQVGLFKEWLIVNG